MKAIFKREYRSYYTGIIGYVFAAFVLLFAGIFSMIYNLNGNYANFEYVLPMMTFVFLVTIPILTMRVMAEERRQKTDQLLYSLPLGMGKIVMGKYLAMLAVIALPCVIMCIYPLIFMAFGNVYLPSAYSALFAFLMLGAALAAIGMFISTITENQDVAAGICFVVMLLLYFMGSLASFVPATAFSSLIALAVLILVVAVIVRLLTKSTFAALVVFVAGEVVLVLAYVLRPEWFEGLFLSFVQQLSPFVRFDTFIDGIFDINALVYFISIIVIFLFLSVQSMEKRRWS